MIEITRKEFKKDPVFRKVYRLIKANHKVAKHTMKVLIENRKVKDFCEEARHFAILQGGNPLYVHYDVSSWYQAKDRAMVKIESIGFYDNFIEYEIARARGLHSTDKSDIPNIN